MSDKPSRTALFTDLFINRSVAGLKFWPRTYLKLEGVVAPRGGIPRLYKYATLNRQAARISAAKVMAWQPRRLLFAHGEAFSEPAPEVIKREFPFLIIPCADN